MSYDLAFFANRKGLTLEEVRASYQQACAGEAADEEGDDATLQSFVSALERRYPQLSALQAERLDDSPWACDFEQGSRHLIVCMSFRRAEEVGAFIQQLLHTHSIVLYDPQADQAFIDDQPLA